MNPSNYQRAQVAPTVGNVAQAENLIKKLGLENSLHRRYLGKKEISEFVWKPVVANYTKPVINGIFANIETKQKTSAITPNNELPLVTMTWSKFVRTILSNAAKMEVKVNSDITNRFAALTTAVDENAPNILKWTNTVAWYYESGADADIRNRVVNAGGQYEGNKIRCSAIWETYSDLDIHCITPNGTHIFFGNKQDCITTGWLDVDMNAGRGATLKPVENIRFVNPTNGKYRFYIHNYCERGNHRNSFKVELEVTGKIYVFDGVASGTGFEQTVFEFEYCDGAITNLTGNVSANNSNMWNLEANQFHEITGIVDSPNKWNNQQSNSFNHLFFLIKDCNDVNSGKGRGVFNEMLKPELREIRKTLESYYSTAIIENVDNPACGVGFSQENDWNLTLRITLKTGGTQLVKIDRFD